MSDQSLQAWVGRSRTVDDVLDARQANLMCATMDMQAILTKPAARTPSAPTATP